MFAVKKICVGINSLFLSISRALPTNPRSRCHVTTSSIENETGKVAGYDPIRPIHHFTDPHVRAHAAKHIGIARIHVVFPAVQIDHAPDSVSGCFHKIGSDTA